MKLEIIQETKDDGIYFSASQIKQYHMCPLCWAAKYLDGMERQVGAAAYRGIAIHKILEDYLAEGKPINPTEKYGNIAIPGIKYLPTPGTCEVESKFILSCDGINFRGIIDFYYEKDGIWVVGDHKTTSNFKYALDKYTIVKDIQASLYALYAMAKSGTDKVLLNWVYYKTTGTPQAGLIATEMSKEIAIDNVSKILDDCRVMLNARLEGKSARDFKPPISGCRSFGGCVAKELRMTVEKKSLADFLSNKEVKPEEVSQKEEPKATPPPREEPKEEVKFEVKEGGNDDGFLLLIDCMMQKGNKKVVQLSTVLKPVFKQIAAEYNVAHYSFIPYESKGVIVTLLDKHLSKNPLPKDSALVVSLSSPEARDSLEVLIEHCSLAIRAMK